MVYVSTAGVFDGEKDSPYVEADLPKPVNVYGRSKLEGEMIVDRVGAEHYIVRAGWMMGGGPSMDHKFVGMIVRQISAGNENIYAVTDKTGSPTYAQDFSNTLLRLITEGRFGLYHLAGKGSASRAEVARHIVGLLAPGRVGVVGVPSTHFDHDYWAPRPRSEVLTNARLELLGLNGMRAWPTALEEYIDAEFGDVYSKSFSLRDARE